MVQFIDYALTVQSDDVVQAVATGADGKGVRADPGRLDRSQIELAQGYVDSANDGALSAVPSVRHLGERLFAALLAEPIGGHFREQAWRKMEDDPDQGIIIRLRLVFQQGVSPQIVSLPWEFLYAYDAFLGAHPRVALSHQYDDWLARPLDGYPAQEPLRVLFSYSGDVSSTFVERAANEVGLLTAGQAQVDRLADPTPESLEQSVRTFRPHVLHFLGHGRFDGERGFFALLDRAGKDLWVDDHSFSALFSGWQPRLVVMHSCEGGQMSAYQPFVGGAAWLARQHVPAVVAMRYPITQGQGQCFAHVFYQALAEGKAVDVAVQAGRHALALDRTEASRSSYIFGAPVLWMRLHNGRLFPAPKPPEPYAEVRQAYRDYIHDLYAEHLIRGFSPYVSGRVLSLPLSEVFLPLQAIEGRPAVAEYAEQNLRRQAEMEAINELDWQRRREEVERRYAQLSARQAAQRPLILAQLLREPRAVLLGHPGTGKSTTARYVAYALAAGDTTHVGESVADRVPALVRIATYAQACRADATMHLVEYVERELLSQAEYGRYLRWAIEHGRCLVILDGLDEVGDISLRARVTERIRELVAAYPGNHYLVTSRIVGYDRSPLTREFRHATLQELEEGDRERFVRLWYGAIEDALPEQRRADGAQNLIQALVDKPQIARLAANPLLLTLVVLMHWRGTTLPNQRVQVYQNATDTLIQYWTAQRGVTELEAEEVKNILAPIAHYILSSNVSGVIAHDDLLPRFYQGIAEWRGCDEQAARRLGSELLTNLNEQSGLFLERGTDPNGQPVYGFLHQTFGEYLAALRLAYEMQSGMFDIARYVHRSAWHEPLLLMAGHLSIYSRPQANDLIRQILDYPDPYEEMLRRNVLLAADCLADDIQVQPALRDEVLDELAGLLRHEAPQVQKAALDCYRQLAATRHREAALALLKCACSLEGDRAFDASPETCLNVATALIYLGDLETARPILWPLSKPESAILPNLWAREDPRTEPPLVPQFIEESEPIADPARAQRLRFEHWPDEAADYLLELASRKDYYFSINAQSDLSESVLGPVDAGLARQVLGEEGLLRLLERFADRVEEEDDRAALHWLAAITPETPSIEALISLTQPNVTAHIRHLAAMRLLESEYRAVAVAVLDELVQTETDEAGASAAALAKAGEMTRLDRGLLRDTALMAGDDNASQAIDILLQTEDKAIALSASLHLLATRRAEPFYHPTEPIWMVVENLIGNQYTKVLGLAAARWLALRPGYSYRIQACEALLEAGRIESAIPLLQYLAYEDHGDICQRACGHLLRLGEACLVAPLLARVGRFGAPSLRYQACLALALSDQPPSSLEEQAQKRSVLKRMIWDERTRAYQQAREEFCHIGQEALDALSPTDEQARDAQALGRLSLQWLSGSASTPDLAKCEILMESCWPAIRASAARLASRMGQVHQAQQCLVALLRESIQPLSLPIRLQAVRFLEERVGLMATEALILAIRDESSDVRVTAIDALGRLGDMRALEPLLAVLADADSTVREAATQALVMLGDVRALEPLLAALADESNRVRIAATQALGVLGNMRALEPLLAALVDEDSTVRGAAALALGQLGNVRALEPLLAALADEDSTVHWAAVKTLDSLGDVRALEPLLTALAIEDSNVRGAAAATLGMLGEVRALEPLLDVLGDANRSVRRAAVEALGRLGDVRALQPLLAALSDEDSTVRGAAAEALGRLKDMRALEPLLAALTGEDSIVRRSAAEALGRLEDTRALEPLLDALDDEDSTVRGATAAALGRLGDVRALEPLLDALGDESWSVRASVAWALGGLGDVRALEPLLDALGDEGSTLRGAAAETLGRLGDVRALEPLLDALGDENGTVRASVAWALGELGDMRALGPLLAALSSEESTVRRAAAEALGRLGDVRALEPLLCALHNGYWGIRSAAAKALGELGDVQAVEPLLATLSDKDWYMRNVAAEALGNLGDVRALQPLLDALDDANRSVRRSAAQALGNLGDVRALEPLLAALSGEDSTVRKAAAKALGRLGDMRAGGLLLEALGDEDWNMRRGAAEALGRLGDARAMEPLLAALGDPSGIMHRVAAQALGGLGDVRAVEPLLAALGDPSGIMRRVAAQALGGLGDVRAVEPLLAALGDPSGAMRRIAVQALGGLGDARAVEPLLAALGDGDWSVRSAAAEALGGLGDARAVEPLLDALGDEDWSVRSAAAEALAALGDEDWNMRRGAAEALGRLRDARAVEPLLAALGDEDSGVRRSVAKALGRLGDARAVAPLLAASRTASASTVERISFMIALLHLSPARALAEVKQQVQQLHQSWPVRLQGEAQRRLGDLCAALESFQEALRRDESSTNLLALAHFHLEQDELQLAGDYADRAVANRPGDVLCLLSQAVLLWEKGQAEDALVWFTRARRRDPDVVRTENLAYEHFWGPKALAAAEAMLARAASGTQPSP